MRFVMMGAVALAFSAPTTTQAPAKMGTLITTFMADSGRTTQGLPWSTGAGLPVRWESPGPVPNPDIGLKAKGMTLARVGAAKVALGPGKPVDFAVRVFGNPTGIQRVTFTMLYNGDTEPEARGRVEKALAADGVRLEPLKCDRKKEGETYGNLVFVTKAAGKTASGLHENWNCGAQGNCGLDLAILYRKTDVMAVQCST